MKIALGSDHAGLDYKNKIKEYLASIGADVNDVGTYSSDSCDYPDFAHKVAELVVTDGADKGILVCGTGIGMSMAANKTKGVRAALCCDVFSAKATREHNDSNILCLGQRLISEDLMLDIVKTWLETPFSNDERHIKRINKIEI